MALLECKGGIIFPLQDLMGKQLFISAKKKPFSAGHSRGDGNLERRRISEYVSFRTVRDSLDASLKCNIRRSRWFVAESFSSNCLCCSCAHECAWLRVSLWSSSRKRDSFTRPRKQCKFPTVTLLMVWQGFSSMLCAAPCAAVSASPRCVWSGREALTAPSSWLGMLRELDGSGSREERPGEREGGWGGLFSSPSSRLHSHLVPQGTAHQLELT